VDVFARIEAMRPWIAVGEWAGLERSFRDACRADAPDREPGVSAVDLRHYTAALTDLIKRIPHLLGPRIAAVYWEFDLDNESSSAAFLCLGYQPEGAADDDWASEFDAERVVQGPAMPQLAGLLRTWDGAADAASNAFLVARTIAAFGHAAAEWHDDRPLCAGYHDQSIVFRILPGRDGIPER
jgi:hypothetical protein